LFSLNNPDFLNHQTALVTAAATAAGCCFVLFNWPIFPEVFPGSLCPRMFQRKHSTIAGVSQVNRQQQTHLVAFNPGEAG